jgi:transposase
VINLDNGPENNSHRTQFMARMVQFVQETGLCVTLAYYPPYHSKYNPIERCWGVLEKHWNGDILDADETVIQFAKTMTWKGKHPTCVERISNVYENGVRLTKSAMQQIETQIERLSELKRWFVTIPATTVSSSFGRF